MEKLKKNQLLQLLDFEATRLSIELTNLSSKEMFYYNSQIFKTLKTIICTIAFIKNKDETTIWNEYVEKGELIYNTLND